MGQKHLILLPPVAAPCVNEEKLPAATYIPRTLNSNADGTIELLPKLDEPHEFVPFATWEPASPEINPSAYSKLAAPLRVTLEPGDMLYLPSMWYHRVSLSCGSDEFCCSVNYW